MTANKSNQYQLIVFDWDGTLIDSAARIVNCMQLAAADTQLPKPAAEAVRNIIGLSLDKAINIVFPGITEAQTQTLIAAYRKHWLSNAINPSALFTGAKQMLKTLTESGYLLAIATGKSRRGLDRVIKETQLADYFHATRCADETLSKPDPCMLNEILLELDTEPSQAIMIGDTEYDMQMAGNAKMAAAGVAHGVHDVARLRANGALTIFFDLDEIPNWLKTT